METLHFPTLPLTSSFAHIFLYTSIPSTTLSSIRQHILSASKLPPPNSPESTPETETQRERVNYAFINPHLITSKLHLQTAVYQAILAELQESLRTKTVHSEVLWVLNPTSNISEAIRRYGVPTPSSDKPTGALLIVRICGPELSPSTVQNDLVNLVQGGTLSPLEPTLSTLTDWGTIRKYHKLNNERWMKKSRSDGDGEEEERRMTDDIVTSTVAIKSVAA